MKDIQISKEFFIRNRENLVKKIGNDSVALVFSNDQLTRNGDQHFPYRQNADLFYLTGIEQEQSILALCPGHPDKNLREVIFSIKPDEQLETWSGHILRKNEITGISGIRNVKWLETFEMTIRDMILCSQNIFISLNEYTKYLPEVSYKSITMARKIKENYPLHNYHRLAPLITDLRLVKTGEELELMRTACEITGSAFKRILAFVKPGVTEYEVEAEMIHEFIRKGARGHAYQPIVASGKNGLVLHYIDNKSECKDGDLLLMDFGAEYGNYAADCSRTIPVNGKFTSRQKACYDAVLRVQKEAINLFTPGNNIDMVNRKVWEKMEKEMAGLGLFSEEDVKNQEKDQPMYFRHLMHGVNHFIGLDVHDVGSKYVEFREGMVLTIEPGIYIKEENIGIRIEDNIVVGNPPLNLMQNIPKEVDEIERLMNDPGN
jgi:Xaa-Pro aminopeptidase